MTSNDNDKLKMEEEVESSMAKKRLPLSDDDSGDDDSSDSPKEETEEEETEEEVSSEESSMNQLNTLEEKLLAKRGRGMVFSNDSNTTSPSSEPRTPESRVRSDPDSSDEDNDDNDDDDDFWM
jgi:hypothetical protein